MHACMIYLPLVFWQERDTVREAEMADLRVQLAIFQVDNDEDDDAEEQDLAGGGAA